MLTYMIEYRNMKKGLIAAGLLISLSGAAQDVSTYTPGTMGEGVDEMPVDRHLIQAGRVLGD